MPSRYIEYLVKVPEQQCALLPHTLDLRKVEILQGARPVGRPQHQGLDQRDCNVQSHQTDAGAWKKII